MTQARDVASLIDLIVSAGLAEHVCEVEAAGEVERVQIVALGASEWTPDLVTRYLIDVTTWSGRHDVLAGHFVDGDALAPEVLLLITGVDWSLSVTAGDRDAVIPADLPATLRSLLPDGVVLFERELPVAHGPEVTITSVDEFVTRLFAFRLKVLGSDAPEGSWSHLDVQGIDDLHALVDVQVRHSFADRLLAEAPTQLKLHPDDLLVAGDGWIARIMPVEPNTTARAWASAIAAVVITACDARLARVVSTRPTEGVERAIEPDRFGPQTVEVTRMLVALATHSGAWAYDPWSPELELAERGVEVLAARHGRAPALVAVEAELRRLVLRDFIKHTGRRALRALVMRDLLPRADYDALTFEWRGTKGRIHPQDADVPRRAPYGAWPASAAAAEPDGEAADWSDRAEADDILHNLLLDELVDEVGRPLRPDENPRVQRRGALKRGSSAWSDDDIELYEVEVTTWLDADHDVEAEHFASGSARDDSDIMFLLAGEGWSLTARHGDPDGDIDLDVAQQMLASIGDGEIVWHRGIPAAEWFERRFSTAVELLAPLLACGFTADIVTDWTGGSYLVESIGDGTFAPVLLRAPGARGAVRANLLIDDHYAPMAMQLGISYFEASGSSRLVSGDGWVVEIDASGGFEAADAYANAVGAVLGGRCLASGARSVRAVDDLSSRWGPQTTDIRRLLVQIVTWDDSRAYDEWTDAHTQAWSSAKIALIAAGRFEMIRDGFDVVHGMAGSDFAERAGKNAFAGLLARDLIVDEHYDLLTREWREVVGRIHADDPPVVPRVDDEVRRAVEVNPFLGRRWHPLVSLLAEATSSLASGFWRMGVVRQLGDAPGPFVQVARNLDDTVHVEVGGHLVADGLDGRRKAELPAYGFSAADPESGKPLPFRTFDVGASGREVAGAVLEVLAVVYDVDAEDAFTFAGEARGLGDDPRFGLVTAGDDVYRLR